MPGMQEQINALLDGDNLLELAFQLPELAKANPAEFSALADMWAPALLERDPLLAQLLFAEYLNDSHRELIETLLPKVEAIALQPFFTLLYQRVATFERFNREVMTLVQSAGDDELRLGLSKRLTGVWNKDWTYLSEEAAVALYRRNPKMGTVFERINKKYGTYPTLRALIWEQGDTELYWRVFRRVADTTLWHEELQQLLDLSIPADTIEAELQKRHPENHRDEVEMDTALRDAFISRYGEAVFNYFGRTNRWFLRQRLEAVIRASLDRETLLEEISKLAQQNWRHFRELAELWAPYLYERDAAFFESFIRNHVQRDQRAVIEKLLLHAEADGRYAMFKALYNLIADKNRWNADILDWAKSSASDDEVVAAIDRRGHPHGLLPETAEALYRRNPDLFGEYVRLHTQAGTTERSGLTQMALEIIYQRNPNLSGEHGRPHLQGETTGSGRLAQVAREYKDEALYWALFREEADNKTWNAAMQELLAQDIPANQIVAELEKRHPNHTKNIDPTILSKFIGKYGEAVDPYVERYINRVTEKRLKSLLALDLDRAILLRELDKMARLQTQEFRNMAQIWVPVLLERDANFFESFIVRNLNRQHVHLVRAILPRIEASGNDGLFRSLYRLVVTPQDWERDLRRFAESSESDEVVLKAIERRGGQSWFSLEEDIAIKLYQRNPTLFRDFIKQHVHYTWDHRKLGKKLRQLAKEAGDDDLYWHLFREFADKSQWDNEMAQLLTENVPSSQISAEIEKRIPRNLHQFNYDIMLQFLTRYGLAVWPQVQRFINSIAHRRYDEVLNAVKAIGDEKLYWQVFFQLGNNNAWNKAVREEVAASGSNLDLQVRLQRMTPDNGNARWQRWTLEPDIALALYERDPEWTRPFIERYLSKLDMNLFSAASARNDAEFLDYMAFQLMRQIAAMIPQAYPDPRHTWIWHKPDPKIREQIEETGRLVTERFDRLYAQSPETYVRRAANTLARLRPFEVWAVNQQLEHNPIFRYLAGQHHEAWKRSPEGIRELMESPNIFVQIIALEILSSGGPDAAQRVIENLHMFRALLLGRARKNTKKRALTCLEKAVAQGPEYAAKIAVVYEDTMDFRGGRAINEQLMVNFVRAQKIIGEASQPEVAN